MLAVEGILALHHAGMGAVAQVLAGCFQGSGHIEVRHGRELHGGIFQGGVLIADCAGGNNHIPRQHIHGDATAGAHPDEGIGADGGQLLHGNGGRGAADAGGANAHLLAQQRAGVDVVLPVHAYMDRIIEVGSDGLAPARIAGQEYIPAHVPFFTANVKLHTNILHLNHPFVENR